MATPYLQMKVDEVPSTQDLARSEMSELPVAVIASGQSQGRGRSGAAWVNAPRALAVSLAVSLPEEIRPVSLVAGVAALRALDGLGLKWPNDLMVGDLKVGGILVERSDDVTVVGMGLNLWWPAPPSGVGAVLDSDPGAGRHAELGALWVAELMRLLETKGWPLAEYLAASTTVGREISWDPGGRGTAVGVLEDGSLVVEAGGVRRQLRSGAVRHVKG